MSKEKEKTHMRNIDVREGLCFYPLISVSLTRKHNMHVYLIIITSEFYQLKESLKQIAMLFGLQ